MEGIHRPTTVDIIIICFYSQRKAGNPQSRFRLNKKKHPGFGMLLFNCLGQGPVEQSSTNKPLAMRVVEDALAYSKKTPVI